jgi:NarL family two-component system response regulator LiaR
MTKPIRILLVDDSSQIHLGISEVLDMFEDMEVVGHANNGEEGVRLANQEMPDVILMDVIMPKMNGIEATRRIHKQHPQIKILALSSFQEDSSVRDMIKAGAVGYVLKNSSIADIAYTIRTAQAGKSVFSSEITQALMNAPAEAETPIQPTEDFGLTPREFDVLRLLVKGHNNNQIAEELIISLSTAKFHVSSILTKLNASSRVEAVALAIEKNLVN